MPRPELGAMTPFGKIEAIEQVAAGLIVCTIKKPLPERALWLSEGQRFRLPQSWVSMEGSREWATGVEVDMVIAALCRYGPNGELLDRSETIRAIDDRVALYPNGHTLKRNWTAHLRPIALTG